MPNEPQLIYWDSCVVIAYLNNEPGRIPTLEAILNEVGKSDGKGKLLHRKFLK